LRSSETGIGLPVKYPLFFPYFKKKLYFFHRPLKNTQISNFMKSIQWEPSYSKLMEGQTEDGRVRQTDMTKLMVASCNFVSTPKKYHHNSQLLGQESR
jgi:menaquinone-dependent protoporphyrinogen IX oxidase